MSRSGSKKNRESTAFLYERLSRDDNLEGDSYSVANQKKLLTKVAKELGYTILVHFFDDGISGITMNRPGFREMIQEIEKGHGSAVLVKDLSRLGRNYIEVGKLTEEFFPEHNIGWWRYQMALILTKGKMNSLPFAICLTSGTPGTSVKSAG